ncbi:LPS export ABC transporter periplasmic protein LptC [Candidatus Pelagibacter communis]|uniref:LPS export ABC transporter periplasmic protein LptC n=1 Tax=Candidatus Pelagibacter TaxID=198251 RepID=UPI003EE0F6E4
MKKIIQLFIFFFLLSTIYIFYETYFVTDNKIKADLNENNEQNLDSSINNLIKDLKYEINIDSNNKYSISSNESEIRLIEDEELVKMNQVVAIFENNENAAVKITSNKANYNINTHRTYFFDDVKIEYLDNTIYSEKIDLDIKNFRAHILDQVKYTSDLGVLNTDNIMLNLITKKIDIYMNDITDKVTILTD